jgi:hypothetical protein
MMAVRMAREQQRGAHGPGHADRRRDQEPARRPPAALREVALQAREDSRTHAFAQLGRRALAVVPRH